MYELLTEEELIALAAKIGPVELVQRLHYALKQEVEAHKAALDALNSIRAVLNLHGKINETNTGKR